MRIAIIGAGGVRTPLIVEAMAQYEHADLVQTGVENDKMRRELEAGDRFFRRTGCIAVVCKQANVPRAALNASWYTLHYFVVTCASP